MCIKGEKNVVFMKKAGFWEVEMEDKWSCTFMKNPLY